MSRTTSAGKRVANPTTANQSMQASWKLTNLRYFATLMDICHLKNAKSEPKFQKNKGRVVLRGDIVKDDSGSYAVFTE